MKSIAVSVLLVSTLLGLLLFTPAAVIASETNWQIVLKATDMNGANSAGDLTIGTMSGYTDGVDYSKGEPYSPAYPPPGSPNRAVVGSVLDNSSLSLRDYKAPLQPGDGKLWSMLIFQSGDSLNLGTIKVTILPGQLPYYINGVPVTYTYSGAHNGRYDAENPMPSIIFTVPAMPYNDPVHLNLYVSVPEPSSIFGLASGLSALALFRFRVRAKNSDK